LAGFKDIYVHNNEQEVILGTYKVFCAQKTNIKPKQTQKSDILNEQPFNIQLKCTQKNEPKCGLTSTMRNPTLRMGRKVVTILIKLV
jgi:hypothetical protein